MLASIIINNYNYARFLPDAIESALRQSYAEVEVIVVDDGSTDGSRAVIEAYGERVVPLFRANGGQASAFNAGVARSRGEVVFFLDADDTLRPHIVAQVVDCFRAEPRLAKVQFRLALMDAGGALTGALKPPQAQAMPQGDMRRQLLRFPDDIPWQPTSGNAFPARVLRQIFPMPEAPYRLCADYFLANVPPLFGPVRSLAGVGGCYRVHEANSHYQTTINVAQTRATIERTLQVHRDIKRHADALALEAFPADPAAVRSVTFVAHRLVSLRLDPTRHPIAGDRRWTLLWAGLVAAWGRWELWLRRRALLALWFLLMALAPRPMAHWLANQFFHPQKRLVVGALVPLVRRLSERRGRRPRPLPSHRQEKTP